ncbi:MAG: hypothetical protein ABL904_24805 [Hyphomicrobiaceae bacterium]
MSSTTVKPRCDLRSEYDMACPKCGQADKLTVEITCTATLTINGTKDNGDHYWDETSSCSCDACDHHGVVSDFRSGSKKAVRS